MDNEFDVPQMFKIPTETCPICGTEDVMPDIVNHGPGIGVMDWSCGCVRSGETVGNKRYTKETYYDGTVKKDEVEDV